MDLSFIENEAVADAAPTDAGAPEPVDVTADQPVDDTPADDAPAVAANPLDGIDLDALRALAEVAPNLLNPPAPQPHQPAQTQPDRPPELDMFDPESVKAYMQWEREQTLGQIKGMIDPLATRAEQQAQEEQNALLKDAAHDLETKKGEFIGDDNAKAYARQQMIAIARDVFPEVAARYGPTDRAVEIALDRGYDAVRGWQDSIAKAAVEQHVNRNARLADQHAEPGLGSGSGVQTTAATVLSPRELALKYGQRASALRD